MADNKTCPHCGKPVPPTALGDLCPECMLKAGLVTQTEGPGAAGQAPGTRFVPPPVGEIARLFPQLEILRLIGQGGMGAVYKARQPALDRFVALKVLPPAAASDPGFAERFNREARALARLNHPNIVAVHDFGKAGTLHYLVMEFVDGANLREVERLGELTPEQALAIVPQICEALQFAHNEGIVHRDIKPENLLLDKRGRVKITDFGIAKMVGVETSQQNLTGAKDVVGTPHYMAPEQIEKPLSVDHRADIYSLGVVFYEMLTGELPLGKFAPPSKKVHIDVRLDEVVLHALEKEPNRRYQQASQVKSAVETIVTTPPVGSPAIQTEAVPAAQIEAVRNRLKVPARGLIAAGVLQLLFALGLLVYAIPAITSEGGDPMGYAAVSFGAAVFMIFATIIFLGAVKMRKLRNYPFSIVASVVAVVAGPGALLGLPFGVWALVVLNRPEVRTAFAASQPSADSKTTPDSTQLNLARAQVKGPAIGLIVTGVLDWMLMTTFCIFVSLTIAMEKPGSMFVWLPILAMVLSGWIIYAGLKMMQLGRRGTVLLGSVLAMLVSPGNLIGLPIGIWALVVLNRREVREAFGANRQREDETTPTSGENHSRLEATAALPFRRGVWSGLSVFVLIVIAASIITVLLPRAYDADARVRILSSPPLQYYDPYLVQNELEAIQSTVVPKVAASLNLAGRWGKEYAGGRTLTDVETYNLMLRSLQLQPLRNTLYIDIRVYSRFPSEAAEIANQIAETYCTLPPGHRGEIVRLAEPSTRPVRPNVPLNIFVGIVAGGVIGIFVGVWVGLISFWRSQAAHRGIEASAGNAKQPDTKRTCDRPAHFGGAWKLAALIFVLILSYESTRMVFSHLIAPHFQPAKSDNLGTALLQSKVKYAAQQASVQDIVQNLAEQAGLKYDWQKSFDQTDPLCRQWVRNVTIDGETCQQALDQILKPVGLRYQVENGVLVLSRQDEGTTKSDHIGQTWFPLGDSIEITSVERSTNQMTVKGNYDLVSHDSALLALYVTTPDKISVPVGPDERMQISKGRGEFELIDPNLVPGLPHVSMYGADGHPFASLYFGTQAEAQEESQASWITNASSTFARTGAPTSGTTSKALLKLDNSTSAGIGLSTFGPVTERILKLNDNGLTEVLDLESGKAVPPPKLKSPLDAAFTSVVMPTGVAIISPTAQHPMMLLGRQTSVAPLPEQNKGREWNDMSPQQLTESYANNMSRENSSDSASAFGDLPNTFMFQTLTGRVGLLQITGFTENPRGVKIRYKLLVTR